MIVLHNVKKFFGGRAVVDINALQMQQGQMYTLVGHNGSGKTTVLRMIAGLEAADEGSVTVEFLKNDIVLCMQNPFMFLGSVKDNLEFGLKSRGEQTDTPEMQRMIDLFHLETILHKDAKTLSTGEAQRTSLARALLCGPKLLLLDEPTANVDPECVRDVEDEIVKQVEAGTTVVIATHVLNNAYHFPTKIIRLESGRMVTPEINNVYRGRKFHDEAGTGVEVAKGVRFACVTDREGGARLAVPATDVVLSEKALESSMVNHFEGKITEIRQTNTVVEVTVDIGIPIKATITPESLARMDLKPEKTMVVSFKATAVKVF